MAASSSLLASNLISSNPKSLALPSFSKPLTNLSFSSLYVPFAAVKLRRARGLELGFVRRVAEVSSDYDQDEAEEDDEEASFSPDLKLFVGNLPFSVDSDDLSGLFDNAGNVQMVEVIYDKITKKSRGFAFVTMSTVEEAEAAAQQFNGYEFKGRTLRVNSGPPPPREDRPSRGFRSGDGGSSFDTSRGFRSGRGGDNFDGFQSGGGGSSFETSRGFRSGGGSGSFDESRGFRSRGGGSNFDESRGFRSRGDGGSFNESRGFRSRGGGSSFDESRGFRSRGGGGSFDESNRLYVGNLSWDIDDSALVSLFSEQGKVMDAKVVYDRESGRSRGFGFVTYSNAEEANNAISRLDGSDLDGRTIRVTVAEARPPRREF